MMMMMVMMMMMMMMVTVHSDQLFSIGTLRQSYYYLYSFELEFASRIFLGSNLERCGSFSCFFSFNYCFVTIYLVHFKGRVQGFPNNFSSDLTIFIIPGVDHVIFLFTRSFKSTCLYKLKALL